MLGKWIELPTYFVEKNAKNRYVFFREKTVLNKKLGIKKLPKNKWTYLIEKDDNETCLCWISFLAHICVCKVHIFMEGQKHLIKLSNFFRHY